MGIVKFKSKVAADIVMLKPHAEKLFEIMQVGLQAQGALAPDQIDGPLSRLEAAVAQERAVKAQQPEVDPNDLSPEERRAQVNAVSLEQRSYPLMAMLRLAKAKDQSVYWGF